MSVTGTFLLEGVGFSGVTPTLYLQKDGTSFTLTPLDTPVLTLRVDTTARYCIGWRDIVNGSRSPCPDTARTDEKYDQCHACTKRTGFNPAFYHATSVSPQQQVRNGEPHILYLAYFGGSTVKVGISHAARGDARLLEQGARHAIILETFPSAHIARQYEASIALLPGIAETVTAKQKIALLQESYDMTQLLNARHRAETHTGVTFNAGEPRSFERIFFPNQLPSSEHLVETTAQQLISGRPIGMLGSLLFCEQQDTPLVLALKRFTGYYITIDSTETRMELPARQISLF